MSLRGSGAQLGTRCHCRAAELSTAGDKVSLQGLTLGLSTAGDKVSLKGVTLGLSNTQVTESQLLAQL